MATADPMRIAVLRYLLDEGEGTIQELTQIASEELATGSPTDHERVRAAVGLQIDHLPALVECGLISVTDKTVALEFLPGETLRDLKRAIR